MAATVVSQGLTFDDVLIVPQYSEIINRDYIKVYTRYLGRFKIPIISAPMDYVTGLDMAIAMNNCGAYGIINRFDESPTIPSEPYVAQYGLAVGIRDIDKTLKTIEEQKPHSICIDVAHGHHKKVIDAIQVIRKTFPTTFIVAGNVATADGFRRLASEGADAVRVGIGPGSACSTRENTGVGVPQLTAIMETYVAKRRFFPNVSLIADGGIQKPGDIVKALAAGADAVMLGKMLAGHDESPGEIIDGRKAYRGQSMLGSNGERGAVEGISGYVEYKGPVRNTVETLVNYLKSGMSYVGASNLEELRENAEFIQISTGSFKENQTRLGD